MTGRLDDIKDATEQRVETYFAGCIEEIYFANHFNDKHTSIPKSLLCKQVGATVMIEDNFDYAVELIGNGIQTYLLDKPRNQ